MVRTLSITMLLIFVASATFLFFEPAGAAEAQAAANTVVGQSSLPWWVWPLGLFFFTFGLGIIAVMGGVGGGVLFVPIVGGFFPFHLDFVRGTGLFVAMASSLAAGPKLLNNGLASLRLAVPLALIASTSSIFGAMVGLALPTWIVQLLLGGSIIGISILMLTAKKSELPEVEKPDSLSSALHMNGIFHDPHSGKDISWHVHRTPIGLVLFVLIGFFAGMFGLGAGWANVPVLNLLMGAPLKVSVATSSFMLSIVDATAAYVYMIKGAVLAIITVPSLAGIMIGARIGAQLLKVVNASVIRKMVIGILLLAGTRALLKGLGIWN